MGCIMSQNLVFVVHGFLGQSSDWGLVREQLQNPAQLKAVDLFTATSLEISELEEYAEALSEQIDIEGEGKKKKVFVGYSLGGRIGLHLLQNNPDQFDHYIFLSTNPGLSESEGVEKNKRLMQDMKWASQITEANWAGFLQAWNQQSVFEGSLQEPSRHLADYDLNKLKRAIVMWTLAQQEDFRDLIQQFQNKITWVVGDKDSKYLQLAENMKQKGILADYKIISSGHRIWLDQPVKVAGLVNDFFQAGKQSA